MGSSGVDDMDEVRRDVEVRASIARVWALITEPEHIKAWYAFDGAAIDLRAGDRKSVV